MGGIQRSLARYLTQSEAGVTVLFIPWSRSYMHIAAQSSECRRIALGMGRRIYVLVPTDRAMFNDRTQLGVYTENTDSQSACVSGSALIG
jgi:hypothetical protein